MDRIHLPLSVREWTCPACGMRRDRDADAAINLSRKFHGILPGEPVVLLTPKRLEPAKKP